MDQPRINHGSTWINVDQPPSACRLQHVAAVMAHASDVRRQTSCVRRHGSCVRRHASWLMRHASDVRRHASGVRRQTSDVPRPFSRRPLSVMTTTKRRHFPMLLLLDLRLLSCTAWGNRVVLPHAISSTGAIVRIKTGRGAQRSAAACCYSTKKAGIMPALFLKS